MLTSVFTNGLKALPFEEMLDLVKEMGMDCVEIATGGFSPTAHLKVDDLLASDDNCKRFMEEIEKRGLKLGALNANGNVLWPGKIGKEHSECLEKTFKLAGKLGVKTVVAMSGLPGSCPEDKWPNWVTEFFLDMDKVVDYQWNEVAVPYWKKATKLAKDCGVERIAFELHPNQLIYNSPALEQFRDEVDPMIGLNLDPAHAFWMGAEPREMAKRALEKGYLYWVHAKDTAFNPEVAALHTNLNTRRDKKNANDNPWNHVPLGVGHDQQYWNAFVRTLEQGGYDGVLSIEVGHRQKGDNRIDILRSLRVLNTALAR